MGIRDAVDGSTRWLRAPANARLNHQGGGVGKPSPSHSSRPTLDSDDLNRNNEFGNGTRANQPPFHGTGNNNLCSHDDDRAGH